MAEEKAAAQAAGAPDEKDPPVKTKAPTKAQLAEAEEANDKIETARRKALDESEAGNYRRALSGYRPIVEEE